MSQMNWLAVLIAAIVYFFFGALWYMALFSKPWAKAVGMSMDKPPSGGAMAGMMTKSFLSNLLTAIALGLLVVYSHSGGDWLRAAKIGAVVGFGIAGASFWQTYNWTNKPFSLWIIDTGYTTIGCAISAGIIGAIS